MALPVQRLLWLLAVTAGLTVANLYYCQPLLPVIGADLGVGAQVAGLVSTMAQAGYAVGMLLLVPLGDGHERRRLIVVMTAASAVALVGVAAAPSIAKLLAASFVLGATTVVPQLAVPFAVSSVDPAMRGRSVGLVMSGLLVGILLSRTVSGVAAARIGWRGTYLAAAVAMGLLAVALRAVLPRQEAPTRARWAALVGSLPGLVRDHPLLRRHALLGAATFACFSVFWTTLAFQLASPALGYGSVVAGLFGVVGAAGAIAAPVSGRLSDRFGSLHVNLGAILCVLVSFGLLAALGGTLAGLAAGVVLLDFGAQANHISNQTTVLGLSAEHRNRINTVYMVTYFVGGAGGSATGAFAWGHGGWTAVCATGAAWSLLALAIWTWVGRREAAAQAHAHRAAVRGAAGAPGAGRASQARGETRAGRS